MPQKKVGKNGLANYGLPTNLERFRAQNSYKQTTNGYCLAI